MKLYLLLILLWASFLVYLTHNMPTASFATDGYVTIESPHTKCPEDRGENFYDLR
jgi:hypothetical protein